MAKAAENYLKMHHPSLHKKMYGCGGKVKKGYKKGGKVERRQLGNKMLTASEVQKEMLRKRKSGILTPPPVTGKNPKAIGRKLEYKKGGKVERRKVGSRMLTAAEIVVEQAKKKKAGILTPPIHTGKDPKAVGYKLNQYQEGGQVNKAQALQGMGDVVDAKLTPGEIVLNADQQSALEQELGQPIDGLMAKIGVPGFENGGKVEKKTPEFKVGMYSSKQKFTRERTVAEKKKLKVLRTKSRKKKGKQ